MEACSVGRKRKLRVLVIEDEAVISMELAQLAEALGYGVLGPVSSASAALSLIADDPVDIALVDLHLADGLTGPNLAEQLHSSHGVAVIVVSANPELVANCRLPVVTKPYEPEGIAAALRRASMQRHPTLQRALHG